MVPQRMGRRSKKSKEAVMLKQPHRGYSFDEFTLDLDRGCLLRANQEVKLRPKCFDVLKYLIERNCRLVGKAELMQAVWPDTFVTDDSFVQCLIEIRRAFGNGLHNYIRTVPRRGYIFEAQVSEGVLEVWESLEK